MAKIAYLGLIVLLIGCGQRSLPVGADAGAVPDPPWPVGDGSVAPDDDGPNVSTANCGALAGYAGGKQLTTLRTRKALFNHTLDQVLIISHKDNTAGDLHAVSLPGGKPELLDTDVRAVEWLGRSSQVLISRNYSHKTYHYDLRLIETDLNSRRPPTTLATKICSHKASPDGSVVYVVKSCTNHRGPLTMVDSLTGSSTWVADNVYSYGLVVSADSQWIGYISNTVGPSKGCQDYGQAHTADRSGKTHKLADYAVLQSMQFLPSGKLLIGTQPFCWINFPLEQLVSCPPTGGTCSKVMGPYEFGYAFHLSDHRYVVSPDGSLVLGAKSDPKGDKGQLHAIRLDGSGEKTLASDLFPFMMVSAVFDAWMFTKSGKHVVYTSLVASADPPPVAMGLVAISPSGGKALQLTSEIFSAAYQVSPTREEVAFIGYTSTAPGGMRLELGDIDSGATVQALSSPNQLGKLSYLPDGRGVLLEERVDKHLSRLHYVARDGTSKQIMGSWNQSLMTGRYQVDPAGCVVLYDSDLTSGTNLALLPR